MSSVEKGESYQYRDQAVYRFVRYFCDPFVGPTLTIGAIVGHDGNVTFVRGKEPCKKCISQSARVGVHDAWRILETDLGRLGERPNGLPSTVSIDQLRFVPLAEEDPFVWVRRLLHEGIQ